MVWLFSSLAIILLSKRNMFALLHFICVVLSVLCVSSSRCHGVGSSLLLLGFLFILNYFEVHMLLHYHIFTFSKQAFNESLDFCNRS